MSEDRNEALAPIEGDQQIKAEHNLTPTPLQQPPAQLPVPPQAQLPAQPQAQPPGQPPAQGAGGQQNGAPGGAEPPSKHPPTFRQIVCITIFLFLTLPLLLSGGYALKGYQDSLTREVQTTWELPKGVVLKPGPITFRYQGGEKKTLSYRGPMSEKDKDLLVSLVVSDQIPAPKPSVSNEGDNTNKALTNSAKKPAPTRDQASNANKSVAADPAKPAAPSAGADASAATEEARQAAIQSFGIAIGDLAYKATAKDNYPLIYLLLVAGIAGSVGAQLRSVTSFIYACKSGKLDVVIYWPWYAFRPLIGFVVGVIVVVLVKSGFFMSSESNTQGDMWWLGLAIIVGFGAEGFTDKLYLLGKTLFGDGSADSKPRAGHAAAANPAPAAAPAANAAQP